MLICLKRSHCTTQTMPGNTGCDLHWVLLCSSLVKGISSQQQQLRIFRFTLHLFHFWIVWKKPWIVGDCTKTFCGASVKRGRRGFHFHTDILGWNPNISVEKLLKINSFSKESVVKLHSLAFVALKLRDAVSVYSRIKVSREELVSLTVSYASNFF